MTDQNLRHLERSDGPSIAYHHSPGEGTGLVWLGGFRSDMDGTKATVLEEWAIAAGRPYTRFDYTAHGHTGGRFEDCTISTWLADALAIIDDVTEGPLILVGSSMGGWIATLAALQRKERVAGLLYLAPAPDFTEALMWDTFSDEIKAEIMDKGVYDEPSEYSDEPNPVTRALIEDGRKHLVLGGPIDLDVPVRILQGMKDPDVPWQHPMALACNLASEDVIMSLVKDGDHRLSRPQDLARLVDTAETLAWEIEGAG